MSPQDWSRVRIGDAERDQAAAALGDHFALGRLDSAEHAQRLDAAWSARTRADLDLLFHDLPMPARPMVPPPPPPRQGVPSGLLVLLVVLGVLALILSKASLLIVAGVVSFLVLRRRRRQQYVGGRPWVTGR